MESAITREKQIKKWNRAWKLRLIEESNPGWRDPWEEIIGCPEAFPCPSFPRRRESSIPRRVFSGFPPARE
jgi:putative endonuclease